MLDIFCLKENQLYGSEMPQTNDDFEYLKMIGIKVIISFANEIQVIKQKTKFDKYFIHHEIFITDYMTPTKSQVEEFISLLVKYRDEKKPVLVHCWAGCGRTGLMLALAERFVYGENDPIKAIQNVKKVRSCAVETQEQKEFIMKYKM
ncbi:MAG: dual specificity protein phosphatase family protein [Candidatus Heimdallarchaeota archaeon]|nr:dual specificity protein phosphatase family protein [Candidatus Heimdallarchaeota archaeon]